MAFEEPTSNTDISGKKKMIRIDRKNTILHILKTSLSVKMSYGPILNDMNIMTIPH